MAELFSNAGLVAKFSMLIVFAPLVMGVLYAVRPTEERLALMRPLSLAGIFAALVGLSTGLVNVLAGIANTGTMSNAMYAGVAESLVTCVLGFGCLTIAWLCVALGMRRQTT